jgi:hypothetical protein
VKKFTLTLFFLVRNLYSIYAQTPHAVPVSLISAISHEQEYSAVSDNTSIPTLTLINNPVDFSSTETSVVIIDADELITVAPNPANNYITLISNKNLAGKTLTLYDNTGVVWIQQKLTSLTIDVSSLAGGTYYWMVSDPGGSNLSNGTIIVQK